MGRSSSRPRLRRAWLAGIACAACLALVACTGGPDLSQSAGGLDIGVKTDPSPAELGANGFTFFVKADGHPVADATVQFRMHMPGMEMSGAEAWHPADPEGGGRYRAQGDFSMGGAWQVDVAVQRSGVAPVTVSFPYTIKWELK